MTTSHTPTPWIAYGTSIFLEKTTPLIGDCCRSPFDYATAKANAAMIVKAVNHHAELVEATERGIEAMQILINECRDQDDETAAMIWEKKANLNRAILAKVAQ